MSDLSDYRHSEQATHRRNEESVGPVPSSYICEPTLLFPNQPKTLGLLLCSAGSQSDIRFSTHGDGSLRALSVGRVNGCYLRTPSFFSWEERARLGSCDQSEHSSSCDSNGFFRAILVVIAGQIISQAKWHGSRSRSHAPSAICRISTTAVALLLGSARLILTAHKNHLVASLSAALMVVSLAVGPFVQQAIKTTVCAHPIDGEVATLPSAHYVPRMSTYDDFPYPYGAARIELDMNVALLISLARQQSQVNQIQPVCPTGNCTFPQRQSH